MDPVLAGVVDEEKYETPAVPVGALGHDEVRPDAGQPTASLDPDILEVFPEIGDAGVIAALRLEELFARPEVCRSIGPRVGDGERGKKELLPLIEGLAAPESNVVGDDAIEPRFRGGRVTRGRRNGGDGRRACARERECKGQGDVKVSHGGRLRTAERTCHDSVTLSHDIRAMRRILLVLVPFLAACASAPRVAVTDADAALVYAILTAEDRRNPSADALVQGLAHSDERIRAIARRAAERIRDPRFAKRDSIGGPALPAPPRWPEPAWRLRYRALSARSDCGTLRAALTDSVLPVRLRAADLVTDACGADGALQAQLAAWIDGMPTDVARRMRGHGSWHQAAHAVVALARLRSPDAVSRIRALARHAQWQLRLYAARAAGVAADTSTLRTLVRDDDANVTEAAIESLSRLTGHADDELYLRALHARGAQAVRAAAIALKGSPRPGVAAEVRAAFDRFITRANESERDTRVALLEAAGRSAADDRPPDRSTAVPRSAIELALGADARLRVTMSPASGGGTFVVRLRGDVAPIMAARVLELATAGYYNGTSWHRVEHDFVVQGGGHGASEYVGYNEYFRDEVGTVPHTRGTVGMSTRGHDTGDAQWFINLKDNLRLGRDYTVFAEVVEGIDVVDDIIEGDVILRIERSNR